MENWVLLDLDPLAAARLGLPEQVAVPSDIDSAAATPADLIAYAAQFADAEPDHPLAAEHRRIAAKQRPMALAQQALAEHRWDDALAQVDAVLAIDPQDAPARLNRAAAGDTFRAYVGASADTTSGHPGSMTGSRPSGEPCRR